jgi:L-fuconolactonase
MLKKMKIDAQHHFWKYSAAQYEWTDDGMGAIRRDCLPSDLQKEIPAAGIDRVMVALPGSY